MFTFLFAFFRFAKMWCLYVETKLHNVKRGFTIHIVCITHMQYCLFRPGKYVPVIRLVLCYMYIYYIYYIRLSIFFISVFLRFIIQRCQNETTPISAQVGRTFWHKPIYKSWYYIVYAFGWDSNKKYTFRLICLEYLCPFQS